MLANGPQDAYLTLRPAMAGMHRDAAPRKETKPRPRIRFNTPSAPQVHVMNVMGLKMYYCWTGKDATTFTPLTKEEWIELHQHYDVTS